MKPQQLVQKTPLGSYEFTLNETALHVKEKKGTSKTEYDVPYINIGFTFERKPDNQFRIAYYFCLAVLGACILGLAYFLFMSGHPARMSEVLPLAVSIILFGYFAARSWGNRNMEYIYLAVSSGYSLELLANMPDGQTVQEFVNAIHGRIRKTHRDAFLRKAGTMTRKEITGQLDWLLSIAAISEQEKQSLLATHTGFQPSAS